MFVASSCWIPTIVIETGSPSGSVTSSTLTETVRWLGGQRSAVLGRAVEQFGARLGRVTVTVTLAVSVPPRPSLSV